MSEKSAAATSSAGLPLSGKNAEADLGDSPVRSVSVRLGNLEVRLAETWEERDAAQALRYRVFYGEMNALSSQQMLEKERDFDVYDEVCDHLLVLDHSQDNLAQKVVGTYRLIRSPAAEKIGSFYSASEYELGPLLKQPGELLELGRSCVDLSFRNRPTMQLLWNGIAAYVFAFDISLMFGCASLPGTDPEALALPLSYLYQNHLAPPELRPVALPDRYTAMNRLPLEAVQPKTALALLPPLIKGYLRLGGFVGDGAVIDSQFNTTDVCIVVKTDRVTEKYFRHYERKNRES